MSHSSSAAGGTFGPGNSGPPNSSNSPAFTFGLQPPKPTKPKGRDREDEGEDELDEHPFAAAGQPSAQPGMSSAAAGNTDPDAPEEDMYASLTSQALNADGTPKRPMNAFMIFARRRRPQVSAENSALRTGEISKLLSKEWNGMAKSDKQFYLDQAKKLKDAFNLRYPDYVYKRRPNNSRKKRRTDYSTGLPSSSSSSKIGDQDNSLDEDDDASPDGLETPLSAGPPAPYPAPTSYSYDTPEYPPYNYYSAQGATSTNGASGQGQQTSPVVTTTVRAAHSWDNAANASGPSSVASSDSLHHPAHPHHHSYHPSTEAPDNSDGLWMKDRSTAHSQPAQTWGGPPLTSPATSAATSLSDLQLAATGRRLHLNTHSSRPQSPKHESYTPPLPTRPWSNPPPPPPSSAGNGTASNSVPPSPSSSTYAHANHYPSMASSYYPSPSSANPSSAPPSATPGSGQGSQYFSQLQYVSARQQAYDPHHAHPQAAYMPHDPSAGSSARHEPPEAYWRSQQHASGT